MSLRHAPMAAQTEGGLLHIFEDGPFDYFRSVEGRFAGSTCVTWRQR